METRPSWFRSQLPLPSSTDMLVILSGDWGGHHMPALVLDTPPKSYNTLDNIGVAVLATVKNSASEARPPGPCH